MIFDHLSSSSIYSSLGDRFTKGLEYLKNFDAATPEGTYELEGKNLFAMVQHFDTQPAPERNFEAHKAYADIHYIVSGGELIYYCQTPKLKPKTDYNEERDFTFYHDQDDYGFVLDPGHFTILWPQDGHKPGCIVNGGGPQAVQKVVLKIKL